MRPLPCAPPRSSLIETHDAFFQWCSSHPFILTLRAPFTPNPSDPPITPPPPPVTPCARANRQSWPLARTPLALSPNPVLPGTVFCFFALGPLGPRWSAQRLGGAPRGAPPSPCGSRPCCMIPLTRISLALPTSTGGGWRLWAPHLRGSTSAAAWLCGVRSVAYTRTRCLSNGPARGCAACLGGRARGARALVGGTLPTCGGAMARLQVGSWSGCLSDTKNWGERAWGGRGKKRARA